MPTCFEAIPANAESIINIFVIVNTRYTTRLVTLLSVRLNKPLNKGCFIDR